MHYYVLFKILETPISRLFIWLQSLLNDYNVIRFLFVEKTIRVKTGAAVNKQLWTYQPFCETRLFFPRELDLIAFTMEPGIVLMFLDGKNAPCEAVRPHKPFLIHILCNQSSWDFLLHLILRIWVIACYCLWRLPRVSRAPLSRPKGQSPAGVSDTAVLECFLDENLLNQASKIDDNSTMWIEMSHLNAVYRSSLL